MKETLRIGNYVHDKHYRLMSVLTIDSRVGYSNHYKDAFGTSQGGMIKPIPLTEDWLVKFGFEEIVFDSEETGYGVEYEISISHGSKMVVYDDMSFGIENNELDTHWLSLDFDKFSGVHQLQNLYFALTGEELEINL